MRILVTGGCGFQGSHLCDALFEKGHEVTSLNTLSDRSREEVVYGRRIWGSVTDKEVVEKSVREQDVVFHLAARVHVDESIKDPLAFIKANIEGTFNVLEAVRKNSNILVYASSCEVYGASEGEINERHELNPYSPYAASKAAADRLCFAYQKTYGIDVRIVRPFNVYGCRQKDGPTGALIPRLVTQALSGEGVKVYGTGEQGRDFVHVSDVVAGYLAVMEKPIDVVNLGTGVFTSVITIAETISELLRVPILYLPGRPGEVSRFRADSSKAEALLGWKAQVGITQGIKDYLAWRIRGNTNGRPL